MYRAVLRKEAREALTVALAAAAAYLYVLAQFAGWDLFFWSGPQQQTEVAFLGDQFVPFFGMVSAGFAVGLGFWQTVRESGRGTWLFLLHRPARRRTLIGAKLAVGLVAYSTVSAAAILAYGAWAATPGNHAAPFYWWMTRYAWIAWLVIASLYLGAFLSGIRPGRLLGTRLLPLLGSALPILLAFVAAILVGRWWPLILTAVAANAVLVWLILYVADQRDYS